MSALPASLTYVMERLFNLQAALRLFDTVQESIADYERQLLEELVALQPEERCAESVSAHPNPKKERAMRSQGQLGEREALWRVTGVDLTRIDGISTGAARTIRTEAGPDLSAFLDERHFASWLRLTLRTAVSGGKPLPGKKNGTGSTRIAGVLCMAAASLQHSDSALGPRSGAPRAARATRWRSSPSPASWRTWCTGRCSTVRSTWTWARNSASRSTTSKPFPTSKPARITSATTWSPTLQQPPPERRPEPHPTELFQGRAVLRLQSECSSECNRLGHRIPARS